MANQTLAALRELTEAVMAEFFGNDSNLSTRMIKATNEAQLVLMVQPPGDDRVNQPAPAQPADADLLQVYNAELLRVYGAEVETGDWHRAMLAATVAGLRAVIAVDRATRATPPAEGEAGELAEWLYCLADQRICKPRRGIRPHPSSLTRTGVVLQQQAAELAECREALRRVRLQQRITGGFW